MTINNNSMENAVEFTKVCELISEGLSVKKACMGIMGYNAFYKMVDAHESCLNDYARANKQRADMIFEDILDIADDGKNDTYVDENGYIKSDNDVIQRSRLRVDARKWMLSKMQPKKYGDRIEIENNGALTLNVKVTKDEAKDISDALENEY